MTREDAIKTLKELWRETNDPWYEEVYNMAIDALNAGRITQTEPQTERRCGNCKFLTYRFNKVWCDIKCDNPHDVVCDKWERSSE